MIDEGERVECHGASGLRGHGAVGKSIVVNRQAAGWPETRESSAGSERSRQPRGRALQGCVAKIRVRLNPMPRCAETHRVLTPARQAAALAKGLCLPHRPIDAAGELCVRLRIVPVP